MEEAYTRTESNRDQRNWVLENHGDGSLICFNEENGSQSASVFSCATGLGTWRKRDDGR